MGSGFSNGVAINLERSNPLYYADECVSGTVQLSVIEEKLKTHEIYIRLVGEIGYTTTRSVSDGRGQTTTHTEYHHIPFYTLKIDFAQLSAGQEQLVYNQGQYSWPFQFSLSGSLPPSINLPQSYPHVRFYLQVVIGRAWYRPNTRETRYITIFPRVNLVQNPRCLTTTLFGTQNRKEISLKGTLNKIGIVPGEVLMLTLELYNPRRVRIQCIDLLLFESFQIACNSRELIVFEVTLPNIIERSDEYIQEVLPVNIPSVLLPPSCDFQNGLRSVPRVHLRYFMKFAVKVQGMFTNFHVDVPVIVGTECIASPLVSSQFNQQMIADYDPPPPYSSVVQQNVK
ncbi:unnamed protein product [Adineta ricciae]|uniref:Arrestin C-terminal-like domain-containing protein n=1 Tax=Adineta ricciae TaxID=249248 RepID=A0A814SNT3_ADIRI|nr:unnamed protein product [Adineta ricciae]CAF1148447.1 unnamed protein product [Adineta ricciae]